MLNHTCKTIVQNHIYTNFIENYMPGESTFFHCVSTGHYWRNSYITELSLLYEDKNNNWTLEQWNISEEKDEYDLLVSFIETLSSFKHIIGFNSSSFHLPYLENKANAYALTSPFVGKAHTDLLKNIKPIGKYLHISTKLNDLRIFLQIPDICSEIECIARSTGLFLYEQILNGSFDAISASRIDDEVLFVCSLDYKLPASFRMNNENFYLIGEDQQLKIKVKLTDGQLKLFYSNYKDYFYLIEEETVMHKSLAATIAKDKKRKALPEECFSYVVYTEQFANNPVSVKKYLCALLGH